MAITVEFVYSENPMGHGDAKTVRETLSSDTAALWFIRGFVNNCPITLYNMDIVRTEGA